MALYQYKCPVCDKLIEKVARWDDLPPFCDSHDVEIEMQRTLAVPSPAQWKCAKGSL